MDRYTQTDADCAVARLAAAMGLAFIPSTKRGREVAEAFNVPVTKWDVDAGAYPLRALSLDYNPTYGGCNVAEVRPGSSGEWSPFGLSRCPAREFCAKVAFLEDGLRLMGTHAIDA